MNLSLRYLLEGFGLGHLRWDDDACLARVVTGGMLAVVAWLGYVGWALTQGAWRGRSDGRWPWSDTSDWPDRNLETCLVGLFTPLAAIGGMMAGLLWPVVAGVAVLIGLVRWVGRRARGQPMIGPEEG